MTQINTDNSEAGTSKKTDLRDFWFEVEEVFHVTTHHSVLCGRLVSGTLSIGDQTLVELDDGTCKQAGMWWFNVFVPGRAGGIFTGDDVEAPARLCIQVLGVQTLPVKVPQTLRRKLEEL